MRTNLPLILHTERSFIQHLVAEPNTRLRAEKTPNIAWESRWSSLTGGIKKIMSWAVSSQRVNPARPPRELEHALKPVLEDFADDVVRPQAAKKLSSIDYHRNQSRVLFRNNSREGKSGYDDLAFMVTSGTPHSIHDLSKYGINEDNYFEFKDYRSFDPLHVDPHLFYVSVLPVSSETVFLQNFGFHLFSKMDQQDMAVDFLKKLSEALKRYGYKKIIINREEFLGHYPAPGHPRMQLRLYSSLLQEMIARPVEFTKHLIDRYLSGSEIVFYNVGHIPKLMPEEMWINFLTQSEKSHLMEEFSARPELGFDVFMADSTVIKL